MYVKYVFKVNVMKPVIIFYLGMKIKGFFFENRYALLIDQLDNLVKNAHVSPLNTFTLTKLLDFTFLNLICLFLFIPFVKLQNNNDII